MSRNKTYKRVVKNDKVFNFITLPDSNYFRIEAVSNLGSDIERAYLKQTGVNIFGMSHLIEHLNFRATKDYPTEKLLELLKTEGTYNASTDYQRINYYFETIMEKIDLGASLLLNVVHNDLSKLNEKEFEIEKKVVENELKRYLDDDQTMFYANSYGKLHNYHEEDNIMGIPETVSGFKLDLVKDIKRFILEQGKTEYNITYDPTILTEQEVMEKVLVEIERVCEGQLKTKVKMKAEDVSSSLGELVKDSVIKVERNSEQSMTWINIDAIENVQVAKVGNSFLSYMAKDSLNDLIRERNGLTYGIGFGSYRMTGKEYLYFACDVSEGTEDLLISLFKEAIEKSTKSLDRKEFKRIKSSDTLKRNMSFLNLKVFQEWFWEEYYSKEELKDFDKLKSEDLVKVYEEISEKVVTYEAVKEYIEKVNQKVQAGDYKIVKNY